MYLKDYAKALHIRDMNKASVHFMEMIAEAAASSNVNTPGGRFWNITRRLAQELEGMKPKFVHKWNSILRSLGYDAFIDYGKGIIHPNEKTQAVFLTKKSFDHLETVYNKRFKYGAWLKKAEYTGNASIDVGFNETYLTGGTFKGDAERVRMSGVTFLDGSIDEMPASLRFFTGGDRSVRGYDFQSLGPKDRKGEVTGGKHLLVGSAELERAVYKNWGIAVFYDVGNAFNKFSDMDLHEGAGIGLRYYTPIGAIRLDYARQIGVDDPDNKIHITVGLEL